MELGKLTPLSHRKPIHGTWHWHTTGWTLSCMNLPSEVGLCLWLMTYHLENVQRILKGMHIHSELPLKSSICKKEEELKNLMNSGELKTEIRVSRVKFVYTIFGVTYISVQSCCESGNCFGISSQLFSLCYMVKCWPCPPSCGWNRFAHQNTFCQLKLLT